MKGLAEEVSICPGIHLCLDLQRQRTLSHSEFHETQTLFHGGNKSHSNKSLRESEFLKAGSMKPSSVCGAWCVVCYSLQRYDSPLIKVTHAKCTRSVQCIHMAAERITRIVTFGTSYHPQRSPEPINNHLNPILSMHQFFSRFDSSGGK